MHGVRAERVIRRLWRLCRILMPRRLVVAVAASRLPRATVPGFLTTRPWRFALHELLGRDRLSEYQLRGGTLGFCLHHGSGDAAVLAEIFRGKVYAIPTSTERRLRTLDRGIRVADLGAHIGLFGLWVAEQFRSVDLVAFEPDPANFEALRCTMRANGELTAQWRAINAIASSADGSAFFAAGRSSRSHLVATPGDATQRVRAVDVFPYLSQVDLLKIDVEGGEWRLLADERFAEVAPLLLFLEYHRHLSPSDDPRVLAIETLEAYGYRVEEVFACPDLGVLRAELDRGVRH